jgi:Fe-S oxidoreductase
MLDFTTCTECGRCQSQCPAWNTEKPLSPKLLIMDLRDHAWPRRRTCWPATDGIDAATGSGNGDTLVKEARAARWSASTERPLVGMPEDGGVIDPDVLWSCTTCGACVEQCPVDIEHVDHIVDMRRYQVLVESNFPSRAQPALQGPGEQGQPVEPERVRAPGLGQGPALRGPVFGDGSSSSLDEVEWLFWVGCAGAYEDRAKKTTRPWPSCCTWPA